jgi:hypothetical protein
MSGTKPDPIALLRGVENARDAILSGRLEMSVIETRPAVPKRGEDRARLIAVFAGSNRRFDQYQRNLIIDGSGPDGGESNIRRLRALGEDREAFVRAGLGRWRDTHTRSAFDGTQLLQYSEEVGAYVKEPSKATADYVFDPSILGVSVWYDVNTTVPNYLAFRDAKSITLVGREDIAGHHVWQVQVLDKFGQDKHFWFENAPDFPVYMSSLVRKYSKTTVISDFEGDNPGPQLPAKTLTRQYDRTG